MSRSTSTRYAPVPQQGSSTIDARIGQAVGDAEFLAQHGVHAGDHVLHDLGRRVPDAELLAQLGIERFEERLVEILDGVASLERWKKSARSTRFSAAAVQSSTSTRPSGPSLVGVAIWSKSARIIGTWSVHAAERQSKRRPSGPACLALRQSTQAEKTP